MKSYLLSPITIVINQMLNTGYFPDNLNIANVIPIFKKEQPSLYNNYRPISLLPAISKIFEKVISNNCMSTLQTIIFLNINIVSARVTRQKWRCYKLKTEFLLKWINIKHH